MCERIFALIIHLQFRKKSPSYMIFMRIGIGIGRIYAISNFFSKKFNIYTHFFLVKYSHVYSRLSTNEDGLRCRFN